jgi:uncharacterized protein YceK
MIRKLMLVLMLLGMFLLSSCATEYSTSSSSDYYPKYFYNYKDMCGLGAVYCGPGP